MKKIHLIVGARPNFMKIAPLYREFQKYEKEFELKLIHTGQHYDEKMSKFFFNDLQMPQPDEYLGVGSGSHGQQTGRIMCEYETILMKNSPDIVIVAGDVNSTTACALDAVKLNIPVAHLEAGLRSYDRSMPEEINRVVTDAISDYLLIPSTDARQNLINEGIPREKIYFVGNIMIDSLTGFMDKAEKSPILEQLRLSKNEYILVTLHRPGNVDNYESLSKILTSLHRISQEIKVVFPVHPRTMKNMRNLDSTEVRCKGNDRLLLTEPLGYYDFIKMQMNACVIITDSGGVQEESTYLKIPCMTLRPNTERPITITEGTNRLVQLDVEEIVETTRKIVSEVHSSDNPYMKRKVPELWDGKTAGRIVEVFR